MNGFFYDNPLDILKFFLLGAVLGTFFDVFRIARIALDGEGSVLPNPFYIKIAPAGFFEEKEKKKFKGAVLCALTFAGDLIFCIFSAAAFIFLTYAVSDGEIRIFGFILAALGFTLYYISIGKGVIYLSGHIIFLIKILIYWILYIIIKPIKAVFAFAVHLIKRIFAATIGAVARKIYYRRRLLYTKKMCGKFSCELENFFEMKSEEAKK